MDQLNFWCRWCGSLTQHTIDWTVAEKSALVKTTCSVCGAVGSATMAAQEAEAPARHGSAAPSPEVITAIHTALRHAKVG